MADIALLMQSAVNGGVQRVMINLAKGFVRRGTKVDMLICDARGEMLDLIPDECRVVDFKCEKARGDLKVLLSLRKINRYMREHPGTVIIGAPGLSGTIIAFLRIFRCKTPVISILDNKVSLLKDNTIYHTMIYYINKVFLHCSDRVVAAHRAAYEDIAQYYHLKSDKLRMIYHPLIDLNDSEKYDENVDHPFFRQNKKVAVAVGRLVPEKDFATLIEAVNLVNKKAKLCVLILGDGPLRNELEQLIIRRDMQGCIKLLGYTDKVLAYIRKSDFLVLSSKQEAFGNVLVEAMSCGRPVVATDCKSGGPRDILGGTNETRYGVLCPCEDPVGLASGIMQLMDFEYSEDMIRQRAKEFEIGYSADQYLRVVKELQQ